VQQSESAVQLLLPIGMQVPAQLKPLGDIGSGEQMLLQQLSHRLQAWPVG
jgi:hypothetical protein